MTLESSKISEIVGLMRTVEREKRQVSDNGNLSLESIIDPTRSASEYELKRMLEALDGDEFLDLYELYRVGNSKFDDTRVAEIDHLTVSAELEQFFIDLSFPISVSDSIVEGMRKLGRR